MVGIKGFDDFKVWLALHPQVYLKKAPHYKKWTKGLVKDLENTVEAIVRGPWRWNAIELIVRHYVLVSVVPLCSVVAIN